MSQRRKNLRARAGRPQTAPSSQLPAAPSVMLPLGAMLLASSFGALAQTAPASEDKQLPTVVVREKALAPEGKDALKKKIKERTTELLKDRKVIDVLFSEFVVQF